MENTIKASEPFTPSLAKIVNRLYDDMDRLISRLEVYNDRLAFSLRHIKELI